MKLDKNRRTELAVLLRKASEAENDVQAAIDEALAPYNDALQALAEFRDRVVDDLQEEADGRSERWQESPAGEANAAMQAAWEELELDEVEIEFEPRDLGAVEDAPAGPDEV